MVRPSYSKKVVYSNQSNSHTLQITDFPKIFKTAGWSLYKLFFFKKKNNSCFTCLCLKEPSEATVQPTASEVWRVGDSCPPHSMEPDHDWSTHSFSENRLHSHILSFGCSFKIHWGQGNHQYLFHIRHK